MGSRGRVLVGIWLAVLGAGTACVPPPQPANQPPVALAVADVEVVAAGGSVHFTGSRSYDPDGAIVSSSWAFSDGTARTGADVTRVLTQGGSLTATLTVVDDAGASAAASVVVSVEPPDCTALEPRAYLVGCVVVVGPSTELWGADLTGAEISGYLGRGSSLAGATLRGAHLHDLTIIDSSIADADFTGATLEDVEILWTDTTGARFPAIRAERSTFRHLRMRDTDFRGARFDQVEFGRGDYRGDFSGVTFVSGYVIEATVDGWFRGARFEAIEADLSATISGDFTDADLTGEWFFPWDDASAQGQRSYCRTTMADGTVRNDDCQV